MAPSPPGASRCERRRVPCRRGDDYHVDATALNLHGFYAGLERLFVIVAERIDGSMPSGANWHQELLQQMSAELPGVRPAVISRTLAADLERFRGFRHVVRNVYAYVLDPRRIGELMGDLPGTFGAVRSQLAELANALHYACPSLSLFGCGHSPEDAMAGFESADVLLPKARHLKRRLNRLVSSVKEAA